MCDVELVNTSIYLTCRGGDVAAKNNQIINLKTSSLDKGESGNINFTHRLGIPPSPAASLLVYIDGKNLPTGSKGARIALMAALYNGRSAGYRYMYEWKDNW